ncbi:MAG TPA: hypothetical protein VND65_01755 [Candidatus Binatia bacterium]|nr:hypothetical protein [Candidatus Binatia bacterium]
MTQAMPLWTIAGPRIGSWRWLWTLALVVVLSLSLVLIGCNFASFVEAAEKDLPIVLSIVTNITNIMAPGVSPLLQLGGTAALTSLAIVCGTPAPGATQCDATSLVGQYQAATDQATKLSLLQKIQVALTAANSKLSDSLNVLSTVGANVPANAVDAIRVSIALAQTTIAAVISMIPSSASPTALKATLQHAAQPPQPKDLKLKYNNAVRGAFPTAAIA